MMLPFYRWLVSLCAVSTVWANPIQTRDADYIMPNSLLSDNDPLNDRMAFRRLGVVLAGVGDKEGAVTMWHQSYSLPKYNNDSNGEDEELVECRGCHRSVDISSISICRYCHKVILCVRCLPLWRSGSLAVNICSQKHDWILLPPLLESLRQRGEGQKDMVFVEDH